MALFKIKKGLAVNLPINTVEGYCYLTTDDQKFYVDLATSNTAVLGTNRICLNAAQADSIIGNLNTYDGFSYDGSENKTLPFDGIYHVIGTQTTNTDSWTGNINAKVLYNGMTIAYYLPTNSSGNATLNLTLSDGTETGPINCYYSGTTRLTTYHYTAGSTIMLTYYAAGAISVNGTATVEARWTRCDYDSTNIYQLRHDSGNYVTEDNLYRYQLLVQTGEATLIPFNTVNNSTATTKTLTTKEFLPWGLIGYYYSTTTVTSGGSISPGAIYEQVTLDLRYSFNVGTTLITHRNVYLKTVFNNLTGKVSLASTPIVQTLPIEKDGFIYILLGQAYSTYQIELYPVHPVIYFNESSGGMSPFIGILDVEHGGTGNANGNAPSATKLATARKINGTDFDGTADITTASWGTARTITLSDNDGTYTQTNTDINGSANFTLKLPATIKAALIGNAATATKFASAQSIALTGDVTGSASSQAGWSIATTIGAGKVTNAMLAGSIANGKLVNSAMTIAGQSVSLGGSLDAATLRAALGLSNAMHFIGTTTTAISDGSTTSSITISGESRTAAQGDVVLYNNQEYVWTGSAWELLGGDESYALSSHTHTLSLTSDSGTSTVSLTHGGKFKLTAGGNSIIFTMPSAYTHPSYTSKSSGLYKITVDATGHVSAATAVAKADITGLGIPGSDTNTATAADNILDGSNSGTEIKYAPYTSQQNKLSFDTSTTAPTRTDRLNLNGYFYATKLYSGGTEVSVIGHTHNYAASSHTHGNLSNDGKITSTAAIANGDRLVIVDSDTTAGNKITSASITFDGSTTTQALTKAGTWVTFNNYSHPSYTSKSSGLYKITVDSTGHVSAATAVAKADITGLGIPGSDTNTASAVDNILDGSNSGTAITYAPYSSQQSKLSFDTSTTNPTRTDRLNLNGYLYATKLYSGGTEVSVSGHTHAWSDITGKPSTFTPSTHNHDSLYVKKTGDTMTGKLTISCSDTRTNYSDGTRTVLWAGKSNEANAYTGLYSLGYYDDDGNWTSDAKYIVYRAPGSGGIYLNGRANSLPDRTLTIGSTGKTFNGTANVSWSKAEILGSSTDAKFYRGDQTWSNILNGVFQSTRAIFTSTTGAASAQVNEVALILGDSTATHLELDNNEIIAKTDAATKGSLYLNENAYITSSGGFYTSGGAITSAQHSIYAGTDGDTTREINIRCRSGAGIIYLYSLASETGNRGLYVPAHGTGAAKSIITVDTNNNVTFSGSLSGNASTASSAAKLTTARTLTIGDTGKTFDGSGNVSWSKAEILGSSTNANFYRGDQTWSNTLNGAFTANGTITANGGYLKSTANSNTVTIGSQNANFTHIYNSASIPFIFNNTVETTTGNLGTTSYPWNNIYIGKADGAGIYYTGSKATYQMIRFIDNTTDGYGNGIVIGGGGLTCIGGGESANTIAESYSSGGSENLCLCNDGAIDFYTNCQNGASSAVHTTIDTSGNFSGKAANVTGTVAVANGGTGVTTLTSNQVLIGNGTSAVTTRAITDMTSKNYITYNTNLMTTNTLAYWNGAYNSSNNSNLTYCNKGAFGSIVTIDKGTGTTTFLRNDGSWTNILSGKGVRIKFAHTTSSETDNVYMFVGIDTAAQDHGLYSYGYYNGTTWTSSQKYMIYRNTSGTIIVNGNCTGSAGSVAWGNVTSRPSNAGDSLTPVYWSSYAAVACTFKGWAANSSGQFFGIQCTAGSGVSARSGHTMSLVCRNDGIFIWDATSSESVWSSSSAYAAAGHTHSYIPLSGSSSITGNLVGTKAGEIYYAVKNTNTSCQVQLDSAGSYHGIYSNGYWDGSAFQSGGKWMIYRNNAGTIVVNGNCTGSSGSCTGNAATATKLATAREIYVNLSTTRDSGSPVTFDGSAAKAIHVSGTLAVARGGTGKSSWTQWGVLYASASTTLANTGQGTDGYQLTAKGAAAPAWGRPTTGQDNTATSSWRKILLSNNTYSAWDTAVTDVTGIVYQNANVAVQPSTGSIKATKVYNAVWNDYAETRKTITKEPGRVVTETKEAMVLTDKRLLPGCKIISDTFGHCMGPEEDTPIAVAGRVLVYTYQDRNNYQLGAAVCSAPNGTIDIMTREEIMMYPERIVGTVSEIPTYDYWYCGNGSDEEKVKVNGRIWIYVR